MLLTRILSPGVSLAECVGASSTVEGGLVLAGDGEPAARDDVHAQHRQIAELEGGQQACVGSQLILLCIWYREREGKKERKWEMDGT